MHSTLLAGLLACTSSPPPLIEAEPEPESVHASACTLPAERPEALTVTAKRVTIPRGGLPQTSTLQLSETCPATATTCAALPPAALDDLYLRLLEADFGALGLRSNGQASPHYGSRFITLSWGSAHRCAVADASTNPLPQGERAVFDDLFTAIVALGKPPAP